MAAIQFRRGEVHDELAKGESAHSEKRVAARGESDLIGGSADRRQHQNGVMEGVLVFYELHSSVKKMAVGIQKGTFTR
ncbi:MAG TPA: hypothetical protein VKU19_22100 [Bryobacteraceae bacterium]|nr:hypothetical protein [Bryobacteraceae bacterium]